MAIRTYKVTLDSKNTIAPEPVLLRQGDKTGAVVIDATLTDNGSPVSLSGLTPMFKANTADGQTVIADSTGFNIIDASGGEFTYQVPSQLGSVPGKIKIAYFSLTDQNGDQSTFDIVFAVYQAADMTQESAKDWVSNLNEIIDKYNQWVNSAHSSWDEFVNANKEIIESIDPGGTVLSELIRSRKPAGADESYKDLPERLDKQIGLNSDFRAFETDSSFMKRVSNEFTERGINPEWYTLVANNDTEKVQLAINDAMNTKKELVLTEDYYVDSIAIDKNLIIRGNGHALYANKSGVEKFINITTTSDETELKNIQLFNLRVINATDCVYGVFNDSCVLDMYQCLVEGFVTANVVAKPNAYGSWGNLNIDYLESNMSENGILSLGATDHHINYYMGYNCMTHVNGLGGNSYLFNSHAWNYNRATKNWINGSKFVAVKSSCTLSNIYADTVETAVDLTAANDLKWALIAINNLGYFINKSTYPNQTETNGVPTPKIFTDLDLFKGQLTVTGINLDFNNWLDKNNQKPKIASGKIDTTRMKFVGLNDNGFDDDHSINIKKSQDIEEYLSYDGTYLQNRVLGFKSLSQLGKTKMFASFSLKKQVLNGELISEIALNPDKIMLSDVHIITCDAIGWLENSPTPKLSTSVSGNKIKIYNTTGQTITYGVDINIEVDSYLC